MQNKIYIVPASASAIAATVAAAASCSAAAAALEISVSRRGKYFFLMLSVVCAANVPERSQISTTRFTFSYKSRKIYCVCLESRKRKCMYVITRITHDTAWQAITSSGGMEKEKRDV